MNKWVTHVKKVQAQHGCSYKDALKIAKQTYKTGKKLTGGMFPGAKKDDPSPLRRVAPPARLHGDEHRAPRRAAPPAQHPYLRMRQYDTPDEEPSWTADTPDRFPINKLYSPVPVLKQYDTLDEQIYTLPTDSLAQLSYNALPLQKKHQYDFDAYQGIKPHLDSSRIFQKKMDELYQINYKYYHEYTKPFPGWSERQGFKGLIKYAENKGIAPIELAEMPKSQRDDFVHEYYKPKGFFGKGLDDLPPDILSNISEYTDSNPMRQHYRANHFAEQQRKPKIYIVGGDEYTKHELQTYIRQPKTQRFETMYMNVDVDDAIVTERQLFKALKTPLPPNHLQSLADYFQEQDLARGILRL
jgi:hypothetical protein